MNGEKQAHYLIFRNDPPSLDERNSKAEWFYSVSRLRAARDASDWELWWCNEWKRERERERNDVWSVKRSGVVWVQMQEMCMPAQLCTLKKQLHFNQHIGNLFYLRWKCHICSIKSNHHTHALEQRSESCYVPILHQALKTCNHEC